MTVDEISMECDCFCMDGTCPKECRHGRERCVVRDICGHGCFDGEWKFPGQDQHGTWPEPWAETACFS